MKRRDLIVITAAALAVVIVCTALRTALRVAFPDNPDPVVQRIVTYDTIRFYKPVPRDSFVVRYVRAALPIDTARVAPPAAADTVRADSAAVIVPITQTRYADSTYVAYVSGYCARLDSISLRLPVTTYNITRTRTRVKHWGCSVGIQAGYGATPHGATPYLGFGVTAGYSF